MGYLPPYFRDKIEFDRPKTWDQALYKARLYYEHNQHRAKNWKKSKEQWMKKEASRKKGVWPIPYQNILEFLQDTLRVKHNQTDHPTSLKIEIHL